MADMSNSTDVSSIFRLPEVEREFCNWARVLLNSALGGVICLLGLVGNFLAYILLNSGRGAAPVATFLLRCLALTDNFFIIVWMVNFSLKDLFRYFKYKSVAWQYTRLFSYPTLYVAQCATIWITVLIAAARYFAVCKPYIARRICSLLNVKLSVFGLYLLVIGYNMPRFFEVELHKVNESMWIRDTWLGANETYRLVYLQVLYYIFTFGLPLLLLCYLNTCLTIAYREVAKRRQRMRSMSARSQQDDANITLVMIVVIAVFVLCQLPGRLVQIIWSYNFSTCRSAPFYIMELSTILEVFNSGVNFLIYCFIRPQFRKSLRQMICGSSTDQVSETSVRLMDTTMTEQKTEATTLCNKEGNGDVDRDTTDNPLTKSEQQITQNKESNEEKESIK